LGEHLPYKQGVGGSSPSPPTREEPRNDVAFLSLSREPGTAGQGAGQESGSMAGRGELRRGVSGRVGRARINGRGLPRSHGGRAWPLSGNEAPPARGRSPPRGRLLSS